MMYTRNDWYVACTETQIAEGGPLPVSILDEAIVIWRSDDTIVALEDRCVHRAAALSLGRCEGGNLRCMYHGVLFNDAGVVVEIPGQDTIPSNAKVRTYPVTTHFGLVWVWMGDHAKADARLLPQPLPGLDYNDFLWGEGVLDFKAEARLVSDNLLDFSHLPYVHASANSFQASDIWVQSSPKITQLDYGVRFERWMENAGPSGQPAPQDTWQYYDYLMPGVLVMWNGSFDVGTARALNFERPDIASQGWDAMLQIQTITPMAERASRYHFRAGVHRERTDDLMLVDKFIPMAHQAFNEDRRTIEAQQRVIDRDPERPVMPTAQDRGVLMYNRMKAQRLAQEQGAASADLSLALAQ